MIEVITHVDVVTATAGNTSSPVTVLPPGTGVPREEVHLPDLASAPAGLLVAPSTEHGRSSWVQGETAFALHGVFTLLSFLLDVVVVVALLRFRLHWKGRRESLCFMVTCVN
jgi:hypothetical protein